MTVDRETTARTEADRAFARFCDHKDPEDLAKVFDRCAPRLILVAMHLVHDAAAAEDLVQTAFVEAIECADRCDTSHPVLPWLLTILTRRAKNELRRRRLHAEPRDQLAARDQDSDPLELTVEREIYDKIAVAIDRIPGPYHQVLTLRFLHDLTPAEIARALDRPMGTVQAQLHRGTDRLRRILPRGLAIAITIILSAERGLAAVRVAILAKASASTVLGIGLGGFFLKHLCSAAAVALFVLASALVWSEFLGTAPDLADDSSESLAARVDTDNEPSPTVEDTADKRELVASTAVESSSFRIRGRFVDQDDQGIQGVALTLLVVPGGDDSLHTYMNSEPSSPSGNIEFEMPMTLAKTHVRVMADAAGYIQWSRVWRDWPVADVLDLGEVQLERGATIRGRVLDEEGMRPVEGIRVFLSTAGQPYQLTSVASEADGSFSFASAVRPGNHRVSALGGSGQGWLRVERPTDLKVLGSAVVDIVLAPMSGIFHGRVLLESTREAVAWVSVTVGPSDAQEADRSNRDGSLSFHAPSSWTEETPVEVESDTYELSSPCTWGELLTTGEVLVRLRDTLWFTARDSKTGQILDDVGLQIIHGVGGFDMRTRKPIPSVVMDGHLDGERGIVPPAGECVVWIRRDGYVPAYVRVAETDSDRRVERHSIQLDRAVPIQCKVVDSAGAHIAGCKVEALVGVLSNLVEKSQVLDPNVVLPLGSLTGVEQRHLAVFFDSATSDAQGTAAIQVPPGGGFCLRVTPIGRRPFRVCVVPGDFQAGIVRVTTRAPRVITGLVAPAQWVKAALAEPKPHVLFSHEAPSGGLGHTVPAAAAAMQWVLDMNANSAVVDREGRFEFEFGVKSVNHWSLMWHMAGERGQRIAFRHRGAGLPPDGIPLEIDMSAFTTVGGTLKFVGGTVSEVRLVAQAPLAASFVLQIGTGGVTPLDLPGGSYEISTRKDQAAAWIVLADSMRVEPSAGSFRRTWDLRGTTLRLKPGDSIAAEEWWGVTDQYGNRQVAATGPERDAVFERVRPGQALLRRFGAGSSGADRRAFLERTKTDIQWSGWRLVHVAASGEQVLESDHE